MSNRREHGTRAGTVIEAHDGMARVSLDDGRVSWCRAEVACSEGDRVQVALAGEPPISKVEGGE